MTTETTKRTLTLNEAAAFLGCGTTLAYRLVRTGKMPGVIRLGRKILISRKALERWVDGELNGNQPRQ